jgi:hypothetical protein
LGVVYQMRPGGVARPPPKSQVSTVEAERARSTMLDLYQTAAYVSLSGKGDAIGMSEYIRGFLVLLIGWALIALGVFVSEGASGASGAFVVTGVVVLTASLVLLMRPRG